MARPADMNVLRRIIAAPLGLLLLAGCSSTSPNTASLTSFVTGIQTSTGTVGAQTAKGAPPTANGGPTLTATTVGPATTLASVTNGTSTSVHLRAASAFSQVFVSVIDGPLDGFYTITLPTPTTDTVVVVQLGGTIPVNTFQTVFSVAMATGQVGPSTSIANTVSSATVTGYPGTWNVGHTITGSTGTCVGAPLGFVNDGQITVDASGNFNYPGPPGTTVTFPGHFNLSTGAWSLSGTLGVTFGCISTDTSVSFSSSGTCSSFATSCTGSGTTVSNPSGGTVTYTVLATR